MSSELSSFIAPALLAEARKGDEEALQELLRHWKAPLFRLAMNMLADPLAADLTVQTVFQSVRKELRFLPTTENLDRWIWALASEHCLHRARTNIPKPFLPPHRQGLLIEALRGIEPEGRLAYLLHDIEGLSLDAVGWIFEQSEEELIEQLHYVRRSLHPTSFARRRRYRKRVLLRASTL